MWLLFPFHCTISIKTLSVSFLSNVCIEALRLSTKDQISDKKLLLSVVSGFAQKWFSGMNSPHVAADVSV